ncbi:hypothetical protein QCA50_012397 [Cerrena zonata]|uniref:Fungal-type protein kinase domain-containing protein n=1 Tax=Cerrena zonata TaxID=2478898 RepID=A0AAW0FSY8_9APHY
MGIHGKLWRGEEDRANVFRPGRSNNVTMAKIKKLREDWAKPTPQSKNTSKAATPEPPKPTTPSKITTRAGSKRKAAAEAAIRITKKIKIDKTRAASTLRTRPLVKFTGPEMQTAKYINELLSHGIRAYAFGFLLQETRMSLWYVDRMGMATSQSFDIFLNPELFVLVVAALHFADRDKLGTIPLVKYPDGASRSHDKAVLELPRAIGSDGTPIDEQLSFRLRVSAASPLIVAYGAVGRGTTVIPITPNARARELFGKDKLIAKLCWPSTNRRSETEMIRTIRTKLWKNRKAKAYLKNIVDLKCSLDMSTVEIGLPRAFMDLTEPYEPRLLRILIMKEYLSLRYIQSLDDFKVVFVNIFNAHHWVFEVAGILHRDPSLNNFMFYYDRNGKAVGVLTDWDAASPRQDTLIVREGIEDECHDEAMEVPSSVSTTKDKTTTGLPPSSGGSKTEETETQQRPRYRTGTGAFMALDLMASKRIAPRYRHDLESFFYVLCYFCAQFRPVGPGNPKAYFDYLHDWENGSISQVQSKRQEFLVESVTFRNFFKDTHPAYRPLLEQWINPLHRQLMELQVYTARLVNRFGRLTFAQDDHNDKEARRLLKELQSISDEVDSIVTYEVFRDVLLI